MGIPGPSMPALRTAPYDTVARKWLALAERRMAHLVELRNSGRWKHYFTESELAEQLREVYLARERFAKVAEAAVELAA
jgi:hypothetical protein